MDRDLAFLSSVQHRSQPGSGPAQAFPVPVVPWFEPRVEPRERRRAAHLAWRWRQEDPRIQLPEALRPVAVRHLGPGRSLHLDDMAGVSLVGGLTDANLLQFRSRLRAVEGDLVACAGDPIPDYETYCRETLGLGRVEWLHPRQPEDPMALSRALWDDPVCQRRLHEVARNSSRFYVHPHMGCAAAWSLAWRLHEECRAEVRVVAPHPRLTQVLNHKLGFSRLVKEMFGAASIPETHSVCGPSALARYVRDLSSRHRHVVIKVPDSVGGRGNLLVDAQEIRKHTLRTVIAILRPQLERLCWHPPQRLLVSAWLEPIRSSPSVQLWIPPPADGPPILEGIFEQQVKDGMFQGSRGAALDGARVEAARRAVLLGLVLQDLDYVGRCSFDLVIVGRHPGEARPVFLESNARWGGCSLPMTLMTRLFGRWQSRPYLTRVVSIPGIDREPFSALLARLGDDLYDVRTGHGSLVLYGPGRVATQSAIGMIAMGRDRAAAEACMDAVTARLTAAS